LEVFLRPAYSPDLNPIEQLWHHTKGNSVGRKAVKSIEQLKRLVINRLQSLQKLPKIISSLFDHPDCTYIGDAECL
jgi:transposase